MKILEERVYQFFEDGITIKEISTITRLPLESVVAILSDFKKVKRELEVTEEDAILADIIVRNKTIEEIGDEHDISKVDLFKLVSKYCKESNSEDIKSFLYYILIQRGGEKEEVQQATGFKPSFKNLLRRI